MNQTVFFLSGFLIFYVFLGYPLSLHFISIWRNRESRRGKHLPSVTIIITAFNEEKTILEKIENTLAITYPRGNLQIIIASDGSTDKTEEIIARYEEKGIELLSIKERGGKENAQKEAVKRSRGEILVFTDVATMLDPWGIMQIVSNFQDPGVGCVSSVDRVIGKSGKPSGEGLYVRYEMYLRNLEGRVNTLVGLSGSFFAARKIVCEDFSGDMDSDFRTLLNTVKQGMRGTCDREAIGYYLDLSDQRKEFERKVRTVLRGLTVFFSNIEFLNVFKYGLFSYQLFCHKLLRWLVPFFLILLFIVNIPLALTSNLYAALLAAQCIFYGVCLLSVFYDLYSSRMTFIKIPVYLVTVNASIIVAWFRYVTGKRILVWTPSER